MCIFYFFDPKPPQKLPKTLENNKKKSIITTKKSDFLFSFIIRYRSFLNYLNQKNKNWSFWGGRGVGGSLHQYISLSRIGPKNHLKIIIYIIETTLDEIY